MPDAEVTSFVDRFRAHVAAAPGKTALVFCSGSREQDAEELLSYAQLDEAARARAAWLQEHCRAGDRALLVYPAGTEFVCAFLACLYAGIVPVPVPRSAPGSDRGQLERTARILPDADATIVLTTAAEADSLRMRLRAQAEGPTPPVVCSDRLSGDGEAWCMPLLTPQSLAVLQYTSGSTSDPKGVMVTHGSLLANLAAVQQQCASGPTDVGVGWLPHFHDMGLLGILLHPLFVGGTCVFMAPISFLKRPVRWLEALSRWRGTMLAAPDFAFDMCARVVSAEQSDQLDLSSIRCALNGAEPIRAATLGRFSRRFASVGFRRGAFMPCYGMAEVTLMATMTRAETTPTLYVAEPRALERNELVPGMADDGVRLVGCGKVDAVTVRIVDHVDGRVLRAGQIGEIWLDGPSVAAGYWRQPELTATVFQAFTADGEGPFLRTGDLGALVRDELFVTGRLKEMLVVRGRNLYPQDIEYAIRDVHPALATGGGAVFGVTGDREHVVVVHEIRRALLAEVGLDVLAARLATTVAVTFDVPAPSVILTNRGTVRRTTSGKIQRGLMRTLFLEDRLPACHEALSPGVRALRDELRSRGERRPAMRGTAANYR